MNASNPLVSTVIATHNMGRFLLEAVESVRSQTYSPIEIIIVDDGSTDETETLVEQWCGDPRVRYFRQTNQGQTRAKNRAISEASGDYIAFLDADDRWKPTKLERQMPLFDEGDAVGVVYSDAVFINEAGRPVGRRDIVRPQGWVTKELLRDNFVEFGSAVVARRALDSMGVFDDTMAMSIDYDLWLRLSTAYQFRCVDEPLFEYRIWPGQMSTKLVKRLQCVFRILDKFEKKYPNVVSRRALKFARASTFVSQGLARVEAGQQKRNGVSDILAAISLSPLYLRAWKSLVKVLIAKTPI